MPQARVSWLSFFRVLWPSWRFFDSADANAYLFYRVSPRAGEWSAWTPVPRAPKLGAMAWIWNPIGNEELAAAAVVEGLLREAENYSGGDSKAALNALESRASYRLVLNYLQRRVPELGTGGTSFQFKISYVRCGPSELTPLEDAVISKTHTAEPA